MAAKKTKSSTSAAGTGKGSQLLSSKFQVTKSSATSIGKTKAKLVPPKSKAEEGEVPELDVNGYRDAFNAAKQEMGPKVHGASLDQIQVILRVFDHTSDYGPMAGQTRLERWKRAQELGLNPPSEVAEILLTREGREKPEYRDSIFFDV